MKLLFDLEPGTVLSFTDDKGELIDKNELPRVLFMMHQWFTTSETLAETFQTMYP